MVYADTNINTIFCQRESGKDNKMVVIAQGGLGIKCFNTQ
jgi:hypothetical protein